MMDLHVRLADGQRLVCRVPSGADFLRQRNDLVRRSNEDAPVRGRRRLALPLCVLCGATFPLSA